MEEFISQLANEDPDERQMAAFELGQTEDKAAVPHLIGALNDEDLYVRVYAIQALGELEDASCVSALCQLISPDVVHPSIFSNVCRVLGELGNSEAVPTLVAKLKSNDGFTRYDAAFALGEIGDASAVPALEELLGDDTMPEREDEDGDFQDTIYSVGEQAKRAIEMINS